MVFDGFIPFIKCLLELVLMQRLSKGLHIFVEMSISDKHLQSVGSQKKFKILIVGVFLDFKSA